MVKITQERFDIAYNSYKGKIKSQKDLRGFMYVLGFPNCSIFKGGTTTYMRRYQIVVASDDKVFEIHTEESALNRIDLNKIGEQLMEHGLWEDSLYQKSELKPDEDLADL